MEREDQQKSRSDDCRGRRLWLTVATLAATSLVVAQASAVDMSTTAVVVGKTPERIGYNAGHFMPGSNTAAWWKYSGVNAARVWSSPSDVEPSDDNGVWGDGVGSSQQFLDRRAALRANPLSPTYINWPYLESNYANKITAGVNTMKLDYAFSTLHGMGVDPVVEINRSAGSFPFHEAGAPAASVSAAGWADRWEHWQHFYAQAFYLAKNFDVHRFQMYNEPSTSDISVADYLDRLRLASDAVQDAVADVNALYGKSLDPQMQGPVSAGGTSQYSIWGAPIMQSLHTNFLGQTDPNFQLIDTYAYQQYNLSGPSFGSQLASIKSSVNAAAGGAPMRFAITEFNVHTASAFDGTTETEDSPAIYSTFGSILSNLAKNQPDELYVFKFSQTPNSDPGSIKKNGVHYVDNDVAPYDIGGISKGGEAVRLFVKGFAGAHDLLSGPTPSGTGAPDFQVAAAHNVQSHRYSLYSTNLGAGSQTVNLNMSAWNVAPGAVVTIEEVSADRQGEVRQLIDMPASRQITLTQPAQSVFLVTVPEKAPAYRAALAATDDAMVKAGSNSAFNYGSSGNLFAKNEPTNGAVRNVSFIKFNLGQLRTAGVEQAVLKVWGENDGSASQVIAHVYGLADDQWSELSINWNNAPNLAPSTGAIDDISDNFIEDVGGSASILGHLTGTQTPRELMLDVTSFVKDHPDSQVTFLIARELRFVGDNIDDADTSLKLASKERVTDPGPQLLLSLSPAVLPGDFDGNGVVDGFDLSAWQAGAGMTAGADASDGDTDFDGDVDGDDFLAWQQSLGTHLPASAVAASVTVPEPGAIVLFALGLFWQAARR